MGLEVLLGALSAAGRGYFEGRDQRQEQKRLQEEEKRRHEEHQQQQAEHKRLQEEYAEQQRRGKYIEATPTKEEAAILKAILDGTATSDMITNPWMLAKAEYWRPILKPEKDLETTDGSEKKEAFSFPTVPDLTPPTFSAPYQPLQPNIAGFPQASLSPPNSPDLSGTAGQQAAPVRPPVNTAPRITPVGVARNMAPPSLREQDIVDKLRQRRDANFMVTSDPNDKRIATYLPQGSHQPVRLYDLESGLYLVPKDGMFDAAANHEYYHTLRAAKQHQQTTNRRLPWTLLTHRSR